MNFDFNKYPGQRLHNPCICLPISPLVTIITPFYNAGEFFDSTFNSVINQTFPWFEWIIIDDGSTNIEDVALLQHYVSLDSRIKYFKQDNKGIAGARNLAISKSSTNFIVPLDADDLISPIYLEMNYWALMFAPDAAWSYTDSVGFGQQNYLWKKHFSSEQMRIHNLLTCTAMIRKSALLEVDCYSEISKNFNEDWHMWLKLLSKHYYPLHLSGYHFWYRRTCTGVLSHIHSNSRERKLSEKIISATRKHVPDGILAKEYPIASEINQYIEPNLTKFQLTKCSSGKPGVLLLLPWLQMGGADAFNLAFINASRYIFNIGIITTTYNENIWRQRFENYCDDIFSLPDFLEVKDYAEFISYYIVTRNIQLIMLSNSYFGYYLIPWIRSNFPQISIVDYVHMEEWYWRNGGYARTSGIFGALINKTFVCNRNTKDVLVNNFFRSDKTIQVSYIGVDVDYYNPELINYGQIRKKFQLIDKNIILFPCRLDEQKRPLLMVDIICTLKKDFPNIVALVVGDGPLKSTLEHVIKEKGLSDAILLLGMQEDLRPFYKDSNLTLICSIKEGLALTAYESMAMGTPVISADVGGQRDLIDSSVGRLVPLMQSEEFFINECHTQTEVLSYVQIISELLNNQHLYQKLRAECRKRILENFSQKILLENFSHELLKLVQSPETIAFNQQVSKDLHAYSTLSRDYLTIYCEVENYVNSYNYGLNRNEKQELMRIINSKWGQYALKIFFKLKIHKLFH